MATPLPTFRPKLYERLRNDIRIDQMLVAEELMESPDLVQTAAEHCAEAMAKRDELASQLKIVMAERGAAYRKRRVDGKARTETEIKSLVEGDEEVNEVSVKFERARTDVALWQALVNSAQLKHSALKRVADMIVSGYLTTPSVVGNRRKEMAELRNKRKAERDGDDAGVG